jgi:hypothetical protein
MSLHLTLFMKKPSWHTPIVLAMWREVTNFQQITKMAREGQIDGIQFTANRVPLIVNEIEYLNWTEKHLQFPLDNSRASGTLNLTVARTDYYYELKPD